VKASGASVDSGVVAMVLLGGAVLAALVVGATRWTFSRQADQGTFVRESDAAFQQVAAAFGLAFAPGRVMQHPVMGDVAAFGTAQGPHRGFRVTLRVTSDADAEPPVVFRTEITLDVPPGATFAPAPAGALAQRARRLVVDPLLITFEPLTPRRAASLSYEFYVVTDPATLRALVDALCDLGERVALRRGAR
jgi:hypothetical protein